MENNIVFEQGDIVLSNTDNKIYVVLSCYCGVVRCVSLKTMLCGSELPNIYEEIFQLDQIISMRGDKELPGIQAAKAAIKNVISDTDKMMRRRLEFIEGKIKFD